MMRTTVTNSKIYHPTYNYHVSDQYIGYHSELVEKPKENTPNYLNRDYSKITWDDEEREHKDLKPISEIVPDVWLLIPDKTSEEWEENDKAVEEWEAGTEDNQKMRHDVQLSHAGIPDEFCKAEINRCHEGARKWADSVLDGTNEGKNLHLKGKVGRGKTYTACAVMLYLMPKVECIFTQFDQILREIKATYDNHGSEEEIVRKYASVSVLCLDDFGKTRMTEWALPVLFSIIDSRWNRHLPTIFTTQYEGLELTKRLMASSDEEAVKAIRSRMSNSVVIKLEGEDRRRA